MAQSSANGQVGIQERRKKVNTRGVGGGGGMLTDLSCGFEVVFSIKSILNKFI